MSCSREEEEAEVCVVGAGVVGLSTAVCLQDMFGDRIHVTVMGDKFLTDTTSAGAAGIFLPHATDGTALDVSTWAEDSMRHYSGLLTSPDCVRAGLQRLGLYHFDNNYPTMDMLKDKRVFFNHYQLSAKELNTFPATTDSPRPQCQFISTLLVDCRKYLPYLTEKLVSRGGTVLERKLSSLRDISDGYALVVNCCGLGAVELCEDSLMYPVRGVTVRVRAPWIKHAILHKGIGYVIPTAEDVVLGGVYGKGQWHTDVSDEDVREVFEACERLEPSVREARTSVVTTWAGLRPYRRDTVRVELDVDSLHPRGRGPPLVHNYGHGANGVALSWGTALNVCHIVRRMGILPRTTTSKL